jgi:hypothetical protein
MFETIDDDEMYITHGARRTGDKSAEEDGIIVLRTSGLSSRCPY